MHSTPNEQLRATRVISMKLVNNNIVLSATDLSNHLSCKHLTQLNIGHVRKKLMRPERKNQFLDRIIEMGLKHEAAYLQHLTHSGQTVLEIDFKDPEAQSKTVNAMQNGVGYIAQGELVNQQWTGRPDLLVRVDRPCPAFGNWSYEVADTKLTRTTKSGTILQLCVYSDLLTQLQQLPPESMHVVMPSDDTSSMINGPLIDGPLINGPLINGKGFIEEAYRYDDYAAYYRLSKKRLLHELQSAGDTYPDPVEHCDICQWWTHCDKKRRDDDHLSFVAGIQKSQIVELHRQGIPTLTAFATDDKPIKQALKSGSEQSIHQAHQQAKIQHKGLMSGKPEFEFIDVSYPDEKDRQRRGFLKLPAPDDLDLFFDIESARHAPDGGLEYLLGFVHGDTEHPDFDYYWGLDRSGEKAAFEQFIDLAIERLEQSPGMHIYHFAPYEPAALKRLATRHATREDELDTLLRKQCFVDLYSVARQAIRASVESYSIKSLEPFYGYEREEALADARFSMHRLEAAIETGTSSGILDEDKEVILQYNRDDCVSTLRLRDWLEQLRESQLQRQVDLPRPPAPEEYETKAEEMSEQVAEVYDALTKDLDPGSREKWAEQEKAKWLLANTLEYFRREDKNAWWEYFRLREADPVELLNDRDAIVGLQYKETLPKVGRERSETQRYTYQNQFVTIEAGDELFEVSSEDGKRNEFKVGTVASIDYNSNVVDIKKSARYKGIHPYSLFHHQKISAAPMPESLLEFARKVASTNLHQLNTAQYDLLTKSPPRFHNIVSIASELQKSKKIEETAYNLISELNNSTLAIQGPPGTGKTHTGSHVINRLAKQGKRIGITAVSHKVIDNLLDGVHEASGGSIELGHKGDQKKISSQNVTRIDGKEVLSALDNGTVVGATAWTWAHADQESQLDYLFIDEAGQMSLAMALAAARSAKNLVLLGDPQQLEQPQKATHPEGSHVAALAHLIGDQQTITEEQGLFLDTTYRMHPTICEFTSKQYYDGRLSSLSALKNQTIKGASPHTGEQMIYVPVNHTGNQSRCDEEAESIKALVDSLLTTPHEFNSKDGSSEALTGEDILIVAPYNAQVGLMKRLLPHIENIGTVDKFQGRQAPIVIYSMTSSSVADAPRGMSFLFSPNRFNVATSRARASVFVFGSPKLISADGKTPEQLRWVNGLCRYIELSNQHLLKT